MLFRLLCLVRALQRRRDWTFLGLLGLVLFAILGCAVVFHLAEGRHRDPALDFGDALWFSVVSITTVGYGDIFPETAVGRLGVVVFTVLLGLGAFTVFLGVLVETFGAIMQKGRRGMLSVRARDHVIVVHYPSDRRLRQILAELDSDDLGADRDVVLITEQLDELPPEFDRIQFVRGSPLTADTWRRANAEEAGMAIVLATSYTDPNSDAVVASAVTVGKTVNSDLYTVAELCDEDKRALFVSAKSDAVVPVLEITGNLLVQESQDHGVARLVEVIASNRVGTSVFSAPLPHAEIHTDYRSVARNLIDADVNLVAINRDDECLTAFSTLEPRPGDVLIYLAAERIADERLATICRA